MEVLDLTLRDAESQTSGLTDQQVELCAEILKILFNLTISMEKKSVDEVYCTFLIIIILLGKKFVFENNNSPNNDLTKIRQKNGKRKKLTKTNLAQTNINCTKTHGFL